MAIQYQQFPELSTEQRNQLFSNYANKIGAFMLDSGGSIYQNSEDKRYDILAVEPLKIISGKDIDSDPLNLLKQHLQLVEAIDIPEQLKHLPCLGGLFFALSYEMGKYYEKLSSKALDDLALNDYFAGIFGCIVIIDRKLQTSYLICSNDSQVDLYDRLKIQITGVLNLSVKTEQVFTLNTKWQANFTASEYAQAFNQVQDNIYSGDCYQVNLAQRFKAGCNGSSWAAYCKLSNANQAPFSAFINTGEADILSLSPERFLKLKDKEVETRPIKGTRPRGITPKIDKKLADELVASKKDQAENLMIVDLMRNDLGRSCIPGSIRVPKLFKLETFDSVHHLVSTILGQLDDQQDAFSLLAQSFPGGSITGTPKIKSMDIIDQLEPHRRSFYCGSIGYVDIRGNMDSNISIRTLVRKDDYLYCWAGGGLVSESKLEDEYQETFHKVSQILPLLENAS
ncbi:MAG: aminodeoxychorismate synthase, component I [Gammaproteobacteria bacterium]|nr:MAG: aminodeoxychorismate synthase, component I [Gammaproteobacteria bacterium]